MKDLDIKKLLVFILIIALLILAILGIGKLIGKGAKPSKEVQEQVDKLYTEYYSSLTEGYVTDYNGLDYLFEKDKLTYDDLVPGAIINAAIKYAQDNDLDIGVDPAAAALVKENYEGSSHTEYNAKGIRDAVKILFNKDLEDKTVQGELGYAYDFYYEEDIDVYVMVPNSMAANVVDDALSVKTKVLDTTKKGDDIYVTLIVAYVSKQEDNYVYYSERDLSDSSRVGETTGTDFIDQKDDSFKKYTMKLVKTSEGYAFDSIEKAK
jgi:hypothetical protein